MGELSTTDAETKPCASSPASPRLGARATRLRSVEPPAPPLPTGVLSPIGASSAAPAAHSVPSSFAYDHLEQPHAPDRYDLAARRVGNVLDGKWKLDSLLGIGGMAAVYAATHRNGARAAIKLLPFSMASGAELCQRLLREGYLANKINHPAVVRVLDDHIDYDKEHAYIVMELLDGETTRQRVERAGTFEPLQGIKLMVELCECLRAAHQANVVHRDIKPDNLFLTKDGLKVLDFGIARAMDGNSSLTQTGTSLGTPAYMSPEQARGKQSEVTARSDLYSVGATLLFLLTGETLHDGDTPMELMVRAAWTPPPRAKKRCESLPDTVADVIDRCCAFEQDDRYPDADALLAALEGLYRRLSSAPPPRVQRLILAPPEPGKLLLPRIDHLAETITAGVRTKKKEPQLRARWFYAVGGTALALGVALVLGIRERPNPASAPPAKEQTLIVEGRDAPHGEPQAAESVFRRTTQAPETQTPSALAALEAVSPQQLPPVPEKPPRATKRIKKPPKPAARVKKPVKPIAEAARAPAASSQKQNSSHGIDIDYSGMGNR